MFGVCQGFFLSKHILTKQVFCDFFLLILYTGYCLLKKNLQISIVDIKQLRNNSFPLLTRHYLFESAKITFL